VISPNKYKNLINVIKTVAIGVTLILSIVYATSALYNLVFHNEFSRTLSLSAIKLDTSKTYLFSTRFSSSADTITVPIENKSFPDSLCTLYFDKEWKLKLTEHLRNDHKETEHSVLFPWCCKQQSDLVFFKQGTVVSGEPLSKPGIKFNYFSGVGTDRLTIRIKKEGDNYLLFSNLSFLNAVIPISRKKDNIIEVNYCNNGGTGANKYVISLPFVSDTQVPERKYVKINDHGVTIGDSIINRTADSCTFDINMGHFMLKENYDATNKAILIVILSIISLIALYTFTRLCFLASRQYPHNILVIEQQNILQLRILFNCVILLGFPILVLMIKDKPDRLKETHFFIPYLLTFMYLLFNINWVWLFRKLKASSLAFRKIANFKSKMPLKIINSLIFFSFVVLLGLLIWKHDQEKFLGVLPVLHFTKILYILLAFLTTKSYFQKIRNNRVILKLGIPFEYILFVALSIIIVAFTSDFATPMFTVIAMFLITFIQKGNVQFLRDLIKNKVIRFGLLTLIIVVAATIVFNIQSFYSFEHSKPYRFFSTIKLPNDSLFSQVDEQSKQTVANHVYLVKSTVQEHTILPDYHTVVLSSWKSTFFSDYSVLWSFKIGGFSFLSIYTLILLLISYAILSLLIILNRSIPLHNGQKVYYDKRMVLIFNILLSLLLVQYIYTFLSNLWVLPITGQSPGVLCPSYFELFFHMLLINALYYFIDKKVIDNIPDDEISAQTPYTEIKRVSLFYIVIILGISIILLIVQLSRISALDNSMAWERENNGLQNSYSRDSLHILALRAYKKRDKVSFNYLHKQYFRTQELSNDCFFVSTHSIQFNSSIDSVTLLKSKAIIASVDTLNELNKSVNNKGVSFINNPLYSGCPINATTINFDLQKYINEQLVLWSSRVAGGTGGFVMLGGSVIIASNDSGNIITSASYPLLYNENKYHIKLVEQKINKVAPFRFKYDQVDDYVTFSDFNTKPGSIVKPLLAYCGFELLPSTEPILRPNQLSAFLGLSQDPPAKALFEKMARSNLSNLKEIYQNDFGFSQFNGLTQDYVDMLDDNTLNSFAIGQQEPLVFKDVVQAYTRIKTGRKVVFKYYTVHSVRSERLSLDEARLESLRSGMKHCLTSGTAGAKSGPRGNVGNVLRQNDVLDYRQFLAKTGTAEIFKKPDHNGTSSIIIVTDHYTIGVHLFGDLQSRNQGLDARCFFIQIIPELKRVGIL
jgi:hypothetical protein